MKIAVVIKWLQQKLKRSKQLKEFLSVVNFKAILKASLEWKDTEGKRNTYSDDHDGIVKQSETDKRQTVNQKRYITYTQPPSAITTKLNTSILLPLFYRKTFTNSCAMFTITNLIFNEKFVTIMVAEACRLLRRRHSSYHRHVESPLMIVRVSSCCVACLEFSSNFGLGNPVTACVPPEIEDSTVCHLFSGRLTVI